MLKNVHNIRMIDDCCDAEQDVDNIPNKCIPNMYYFGSFTSTRSARCMNIFYEFPNVSTATHLICGSKKCRPAAAKGATNGVSTNGVSANDVDLTCRSKKRTPATTRATATQGTTNSLSTNDVDLTCGSKKCTPATVTAQGASHTNGVSTNDVDLICRSKKCTPAAIATAQGGANIATNDVDLTCRSKKCTPAAQGATAASVSLASVPQEGVRVVRDGTSTTLGQSKYKNRTGVGGTTQGQAKGVAPPAATSILFILSILLATPPLVSAQCYQHANVNDCLSYELSVTDLRAALNLNLKTTHRVNDSSILPLSNPRSDIFAPSNPRYIKINTLPHCNELFFV